MTEDEARQKWCPMYRQRWRKEFDHSALDNREGKASRCIASDCMMWQQVDFEGTVFSKKDAEFALKHKDDGYCGLIK